MVTKAISAAARVLFEKVRGVGGTERKAGGKLAGDPAKRRNTGIREKISVGKERSSGAQLSATTLDISELLGGSLDCLHVRIIARQRII